jgi:hypothetical protein
MKLTITSAPAANPSAVVFDTYMDFMNYLRDRKCPTCDITFIQNSDAVQTLFQSWLTGKGEVLS